MITVELDISEVETKANSSIPVPSNFTTRSTTLNAITLIWGTVEGASFYQIELDGSRFWDVSNVNTFTKRGLLAETEHSFRVHATCGNEVSEWNGAVKGRMKESFETSGWKEYLIMLIGKRK